MTRRRAKTREYLVVLGVIAAGAALAWWATSQTWAIAETALLGETGGSFDQAVSQQALSASALAPAAAAMPIVGFAALAGVLGSRGLVRRVVGALLVLAGSVLVWAGSASAASLEVGATAPSGDGVIVAIAPGFPITAAGAGLVLVVSGVAAIVRASYWPSLGASYERSTDRPRDAWEALDHGIDPTDD